MLVRQITTDATTGTTTERMVEMPGVLSAEQAQALDAEQRAEDARTERNARLAACDWTQVADAPLDAAQVAAWVAYRQALRDVTEQAGFPDTISWPLEPSGERLVVDTA